jgi:hypothetical protein
VIADLLEFLNMETSVAFIAIIRYAHILAGIVVAITGLLQIVLKKGGPRHRTVGQVYFWAWTLTVPTGTYLGSPLIGLFGALGWYMAFTGMRLGRMKTIKADLLDKLVIALGLCAGAATLGWGIWLLAFQAATFGVIGCFFGVLFLGAAVRDLRLFVFKRSSSKLNGHQMHWYFEHFTRMYISYIAAMTAFAVIQNAFQLAMLNWILPTVIGTALIVVTSRAYRKQLKIQ